MGWVAVEEPRQFAEVGTVCSGERILEAGGITAEAAESRLVTRGMTSGPLASNASFKKGEPACWLNFGATHCTGGEIEWDDSVVSQELFRVQKEQNASRLGGHPHCSEGGSQISLGF